MKTSNSTNGGQSNKATAGRYFESVKQLREILGDDVLLLAWPKGSKGLPKKWGHLTIASMTPGYLAKLEHGNIGVALGAKSGNLVALDLDDHALIEPFLKLNPFLNETLQTHGARGRVFWFFNVGIAGDGDVGMTQRGGRGEDAEFLIDETAELLPQRVERIPRRHAFGAEPGEHRLEMPVATVAVPMRRGGRGGFGLNYKL